MTTFETFDVGTEPRTNTQIHYAGFWIRLGAYIIDYIFTFLIGLVGGFIIGIIYALISLSAGSKPDLDVGRLLGAGIGLLVTLIYNISFVAGRWQATPGKRLLGIHIIRIDGEPMTGGLAFGRWLAYILSALPLFIGFMMIGWTGEKKAIHDLVCGTRVIYGKL